MNGIRPKEVLDVLRALEDAAAAGEPSVLATVVSVDGSVYARAGAMTLLIGGATSRAGAIAEASLPGPVRRAAEVAGREGRARLAIVDISEDDQLLGHGFGSPGRTELLLEPVDARLREHMKGVRETLSRGEGVVCEVELGEAAFGARAFYPPAHPAAQEAYREATPELVERTDSGKLKRTFLYPIHPMGKVVILGSGHDAACLAERLDALGFSVYACDPRPGRLKNFDWDRRRAALIEGGWEAARAAASPDEDTAVVVMFHSEKLAFEALRGAVQSPASYVGLIGSTKRAHDFIARLEKEGIKPRPEALHAPAGLDIGAEAPEEAALSLAAEILAARAGRKGGRIAPRKAAHAPGKVCGLILAAGRGKRFMGGNKLSAALDGRPVLRHVVENALASRLDPVIVVLGCDAEKGLAALRGIVDPRLRVVFNPLWEGGKASSIEVGLREAPPHCPGVVSLLGDMPRVKPWLIDRVLSEFELSGKLTFPVFPSEAGPQKGYPTAFPHALFGEIKALTGDDTAMEAVREHWGEAVKISLEDGSTQADIDTAEDLQLLLGGTAGE